MNPDYVFKPFPEVWGRSCHKNPCPETDHFDAVLNELQKWSGKLTNEQHQQAKEAGERRYLKHQRKGTKHTRGRTAKFTMSDQVTAVGAEIFAADRLGFPWEDHDRADIDKTYGDLNYGIGVRHTMVHSGCLMVDDCEDGDPLDHAFFLVIGGAFLLYRLAGWLVGQEARERGRWNALDKTRPPCWVIDQDHLRDMNEFDLAGWIAANPILQANKTRLQIPLGMRQPDQRSLGSVKLFRPPAQVEVP